MKLPHLFHRDPGWQIRGVHVYYECHCGARRVRLAYANWAESAWRWWWPRDPLFDLEVRGG